MSANSKVELLPMDSIFKQISLLFAYILGEFFYKSSKCEQMIFFAYIVTASGTFENQILGFTYIPSPNL